MNIIKKIFPLFFLVSLLMSCSNDSTTSRFVLKMIDEMGDYEEVNVEVIGAEVHVDGEWQTLNVDPDVHNLLDLTNGAEVVLADQEIPAGEITQIRLLLGENNTVKFEGEDEPIALTTPSGQSSGIKLNVHDNITAGITYTMILDFDAGRSVVKAGASGMYLLKPVIRAIPEAQDGAISGTIKPLEANPEIHAIIEEDTVTSTFANEETGFFMLRGLSEGDYTVGFEAAEGYEDKVVEDVTVTLGEVTDMDVITIEETP